MTTAYFGPALLASVAWLAFGTGALRGTSIVETVPFTILAPTVADSPPQTLDVLTPQFNPSLGTFDSATTTISGTTSLALEFFTTGGGGSYDIFVSDILTLAGIPAKFGQELTGVVPANQTVFTVPVTFPFGPVDRTDPSQLVVGTGTWNQLFTLALPTVTINQSPSSVIVPGLSVAGSSLTTYTYTPTVSPVPEPRFLLLPALLLASSVGAWHGRRKRIKAPAV